MILSAIFADSRAAGCAAQQLKAAGFSVSSGYRPVDSAGFALHSGTHTRFVYDGSQPSAAALSVQPQNAEAGRVRAMLFENGGQLI